MTRTDWHRLFGLLLADFFTGSPFVVELEKDLSVKKQLLDVVVLRRGNGRFEGQLPDGLARLAEVERNAVLHLLSAATNKVQYGRSHYDFRSPDGSVVLSKLFEGYQREGLPMPYTMEDFKRDFVREHLQDVTVEERLAGLT